MDKVLFDKTIIVDINLDPLTLQITFDGVSAHNHLKDIDIVSITDKNLRKAIENMVIVLLDNFEFAEQLPERLLLGSDHKDKVELPEHIKKCRLIIKTVLDVINTNVFGKQLTEFMLDDEFFDHYQYLYHTLGSYKKSFGLTPTKTKRPTNLLSPKKGSTRKKKLEIRPKPEVDFESTPRPYQRYKRRYRNRFTHLPKPVTVYTKSPNNKVLKKMIKDKTKCPKGAIYPKGQYPVITLGKCVKWDLDQTGSPSCDIATILEFLKHNGKIAWRHGDTILCFSEICAFKIALKEYEDVLKGVVS